MKTQYVCQLGGQRGQLGPDLQSEARRPSKVAKHSQETPLETALSKWSPRSHSGAPRAILTVKHNGFGNLKIRGAWRGQGASEWATLSNETAVVVIRFNGVKFTLLGQQTREVGSSQGDNAVWQTPKLLKLVPLPREITVSEEARTCCGAGWSRKLRKR